MVRLSLLKSACVVGVLLLTIKIGYIYNRTNAAINPIKKDGPRPTIIIGYISERTNAAINPVKKAVPRPTKAPRNFTILDWSPAYFSKLNGLPADVLIGNCHVTRNRSRLKTSDVIFIDVRRVPSLKSMPTARAPWQRWVYFNIESPHFAILGQGRYTMNDFRGPLAFNWTMTTRTDADIPFSMGWRVKKEWPDRNAIEGIVENKTELVGATISNCIYVKNGRMTYLRALQKHVRVDVYGKCGTLNCEGHYTKHACGKMKNYKFYLAFENSNCKDYISFRMWMQGFGNLAVPVVLGASKNDYERKAPPGSFIHVDDFESPKQLADYLKALDKNDTAYNEYHKWRIDYTYDYDYRLIEGTYAWETMCAGLNRKYEEPATWYKTITDFESVKKDCSLNKWVNKTCKGKFCI